MRGDGGPQRHSPGRGPGWEAAPGFWRKPVCGSILPTAAEFCKCVPAEPGGKRDWLAFFPCAGEWRKPRMLPRDRHSEKRALERFGDSIALDCRVIQVPPIAEE